MDSTAINCIAKGDLPLTIEWLHNGNIIPKHSSTSGINILNMSARLSTLNFDFVRGEHRGTYTCRVSNQAGKAESSADLNINGYLMIFKFHGVLFFVFKKKLFTSFIPRNPFKHKKSLLVSLKKLKS